MVWSLKTNQLLAHRNGIPNQESASLTKEPLRILKEKVVKYYSQIIMDPSKQLPSFQVSRYSSQREEPKENKSIKLLLMRKCLIE